MITVIYVICIKISFCLGCLAMLAARACARSVFSIENNALTNATIQLIHENRLDNIVTVIRDDIMNIRTLPCVVVDIILVDWRHNSFVSESKLRSIIHARTYLLRQDGYGYIFPDAIDINICALAKTNSGEVTVGDINT